VSRKEHNLIADDPSVISPTRNEDGMTWQRRKWITAVLGVVTVFCAISGITGTWWPVVIFGIAFLIGVASMVQHRPRRGT
jgi:hypothetical protein